MLSELDSKRNTRPGSSATISPWAAMLSTTRALSASRAESAAASARAVSIAARDGSGVTAGREQATLEREKSRPAVRDSARARNTSIVGIIAIHLCNRRAAHSIGGGVIRVMRGGTRSLSYTHLRAHETGR